MSWKLLRSSGESYYLLPTSVCRIGRQGCQIIIADTTVSRHHADIIIAPIEAVSPQPAPQSGVKLKDVSKFVQTTVNGNLLTPSEREITIQNGDEIVFGASQDKFILKWDPIILRLSKSLCNHNVIESAKNAGLVLLQDVFDSSVPLVAPVASSSDECVLYTIADGGKIVKPEYVSTFLQVQSGVQTLPDSSEYALLYPHQQLTRRRLFEGHKFLVLSDEKSTSIERLIKYVGGHVLDHRSTAVDGFVVGSGESQQTSILNARHISSHSLTQAVYNASIDSLLTVKICVTKPSRFNTISEPSASQWIGNNSTTAVHQKRDSEIAIRSETFTIGRKSFKKARIASEVHEPAPLSSWNGERQEAKAKGGKLLVKFIEADMDSWLDSYN
jgi:hypothetical protein